MNKPNRKNEKFFLKLVEDGYLTVKRNGTVYNTKTNRFIGSKTNKGYVAIGVKDSNGKVRHILVHRLVWLIFNGSIPKAIEVNHIDGIKSNNKLSNLELVTGSGNAKHAYAIGLREPLKGSKVHNSVFDDSDVIRLRRKFALYDYSVSELAKKENISRKALRLMLRGSRYTYIQTKYDSRCKKILNSNVNRIGL